MLLFIIIITVYIAYTALGHIKVWQAFLALFSVVDKQLLSSLDEKRFINTPLLLLL